MTDIIIPIKDLSHAKSRLSDTLAPIDRARLVLAMLSDLLTTIANLDQGQIWIVAKDEAVFEVARRFNAKLVKEDSSRGYNSAILLGFDAISSNSNVAVLPGDVPQVSAEEILELIAPAAPAEPTVRLAPAYDTLGTNGMFLSQKNLILPCFGQDSLNWHLTATLAVGGNLEILNAPCLSRDIDTSEDLEAFDLLGRTGATRDFLCSLQPSAMTSFTKRETA